MKFKSSVALVLYYSLGRFLPVSKHSLSKKFRGFLCKSIFKKCGNNINIEKRSIFWLWE